jgi:hypothetical protein
LSKATENKRVIIDTPENGFQKADDFLNNLNNKVSVENLKERISKNELPKGTSEKIIGKSIEQQVRVALRDIFNHIDARNSSFCNVSIEPDEWADFIYEIVGVETQIYSQTSEIKADKVFEILDIMRKFQDIKNFKSIKNMLKFRNLVKYELVEMANSKLSVEDIMDNAIASGVKIPTWFESLRPKSEDYVSLGFIVGSVATLGTSLLDYIMLAAGTGTEIFGRDTIGKRVFAKVNLLKVKPTKFKTPFILAFGRDSVTYGEAKSLYNKLIQK